MQGILNHLNFFKDLIGFEVRQLYFKNPLDCELNSLRIFFFQKSFFFFETLIIITYSEMRFILTGLNCFTNYHFNFQIFLQIIINLINYHLNVYHWFHFIIINFLEGFYLPKGFHQYSLQEKEGYYFNYFKFIVVNFTFNSNFVINNYL